VVVKCLFSVRHELFKKKQKILDLKFLLIFYYNSVHIDLNQNPSDVCICCKTKLYFSNA